MPFLLTTLFRVKVAHAFEENVFGDLGSALYIIKYLNQLFRASWITRIALCSQEHQISWLKLLVILWFVQAMLVMPSLLEVLPEDLLVSNGTRVVINFEMISTLLWVICFCKRDFVAHFAIIRRFSLVAEEVIIWGSHHRVAVCLLFLILFIQALIKVKDEQLHHVDCDLEDCVAY